MKAWTWIKTWGGAVLKGAAGWRVYAAAVAGAAVLLGAVLWWFNARIDRAFEAGRASVELQALQAEVNTLRNLADANKESSDAIAQDLARLGAMDARVGELERMRRADLAGFDRRLRAAAEPAVRAYASQAERDIGDVERSRDGFAAEAVQAATAAHGWDGTMRARRDAIRAQRDASKPQRTSE